MAIEHVRWQGKNLLIKFAAVDDRDLASDLREARLVITREQLVDLPQDNYYIFDIIGLDVFTTGGQKLGTVEDVLKTGANDVYVVARADLPPVLVPALKRVVREVDLAGGRMVVDLPPGLLEE